MTTQIKSPFGPKGLGFYLRDLKTMSDPATAAKTAADHNVKHVAIMACWQEPEKGRLVHHEMNRELVDDYAQAFAARGIVSRLWGYPWPGLEEQFRDTFLKHTEHCKGLIKGWLLDPEKGYRGHREDVVPLMELVIESMDESLDLGVTSYSTPRNIRDFPWDLFLDYGYLSPQVYGNVTPEEAGIRNSLKQWLSLAEEPDDQPIIPSIASFGPEAEGNLKGWLEKLDRAYAAEIKKPCPAAFVWSWPSTSSLEWRILGEWAARTFVS